MADFPAPFSSDLGRFRRTQMWTASCRPLVALVQRHQLHDAPGSEVVGTPATKNGHRSNNLVGGWPTPVKNMSQLGWWHSQLNGKTVPNHQPVIDNRFWYHQWTFLRGLLDGKLCARSWNPLYKWAIFHFFPICIPQNPIKSTINGGYPAW